MGGRLSVRLHLHDFGARIADPESIASIDVYEIRFALDGWYRWLEGSEPTVAPHECPSVTVA